MTPATRDPRPDGHDPAERAEPTTYGTWSAEDTRRGEDEARRVEIARAARERARRQKADGTWDADGDGVPDHDQPVERIEVTTEPSPAEKVDPQRVEFFAPGRGSGGHRARGGSGPQEGPGVEGLFGPGTPLGEATGLRLRPRKRWVAAACGLLGGFVGAQSFYTGHLLRGGLQAGAVVSSWLLALLTLGLLVPLATALTVAVWAWGAVEGVLYGLARTGPYAYDVLGGRLR